MTPVVPLLFTQNLHSVPLRISQPISPAVTGGPVKTYRCPICKKIAPAGKYKPFCSKRCADIDLGNWFNESYRIPVQEMDEEDYEELEKELEKQHQEE